MNELWRGSCLNQIEQQTLLQFWYQSLRKLWKRHERSAIELRQLLTKLLTTLTEWLRHFTVPWMRMDLHPLKSEMHSLNALRDLRTDAGHVMRRAMEEIEYHMDYECPFHTEIYVTDEDPTHWHTNLMCPGVSEGSTVRHVRPCPCEHCSKVGWKMPISRRLCNVSFHLSFPVLVALHVPWDRGFSFYLWTEMCGSRVGLSCAIPAALCSLEKDCAVVLGS